MRGKFVILILFISWIALRSHAQQPFQVNGRVTDENGIPLTGVVIRDVDANKFCTSDSTGRFYLNSTKTGTIRLEFSYIGYQRDTLTINTNNSEILIHQLKPDPTQINEVIIRDWSYRSEALQPVRIQSFEKLPLFSGNVESILSTMGASTRNEMSSQYSVRGGNFDENPIYINAGESW